MAAVPNNRPEDILVSDHGSLVMLAGLTPNGDAWLRQNLASDAQWLGKTVAVEPRYVDDILRGIQAGNLTIAY